MFSVFKSIDDQLADRGYTLVEETYIGAKYERYDEGFNFIHEVDITRRFNGEWTIQSYDRTNTDIFMPSVELTYSEMKLFFKKMKELKGYSFG